MIQELLGGGAGLFGGERKISINGGVLEGTPSHSPSPSPSSSTVTTTTTTNTVPNSENQNLRCPRCDSANTKFCYYNNYNLTQPRHFCKTCRRYWTKGGALRNVPIGGGCRKNKNTCISSTPVGKSSAGKVMKTTTLSSEIGKSGGLGMYGFDHEVASSNNNNPIVWASPQNSHILALLRATQNPNPNPISSSGSITVKDEGFSIGSNMLNESSSVATGAFNALTLGLDPFIQVPSFWRNNQHQPQHHQQNGFNLVGGEVQNSGIQELLYQRMRSSSSNNYYTTDHVPSVVGMGNLASTLSSSTTSSILESAPVGGGTELAGGYWNSAYSTWSDLPTANGAYP